MNLSFITSSYLIITTLPVCIQFNSEIWGGGQLICQHLCGPRQGRPPVALDKLLGGEARLILVDVRPV